MLLEQVADLVLRHMDRRADDVARRLAGDLQDVLAEIGLYRVQVMRLEKGGEPDLLGHHALALGDRAGARRPAQIEHDCRAWAASRAQCTVPPGATTLASKASR